MKILHSLLFIVFLFCGCSGEIKIKNVSFPEKITLKTKTKHPTKIHVHIKGRIEGIATLTLLEEDKPYKTEKLNGDVDLFWNFDWYSSEAIILYEPGVTKSGNLTISYEF